MIDLTFQNQFHYLEELLNQALAERETVVLKRPASATPAVGATGAASGGAEDSSEASDDGT